MNETWTNDICQYQLSFYYDVVEKCCTSVLRSSEND
jgi:hypothetical protein